VVVEVAHRIKGRGTVLIPLDSVVTESVNVQSPSLSGSSCAITKSAITPSMHQATISPVSLILRYSHLIKRRFFS
jgi:hypothetical protein